MWSQKELQNSKIIVVPGDFPDDKTTSDHRSILGVFQIPSVSKKVLSQIGFAHFTPIVVEKNGLKFIAFFNLI